MDYDITLSNAKRLRKLVEKLESACLLLSDTMPLVVDKFNPDEFPDMVLLQLDGFRVRFADLQDLLGHVIFPMITRFDEDESAVHPLSTRERQVLMEKKGLIQLDKWKALREIRNNFMHEYPEEHEEKAMLLNKAWESSKELSMIAKNILTYLQDNNAFN
ncbi:MAG: hypothetical protein K9L22_04260 [Methylococcaceae bacterium]|nr:hypothetical protein [Methylococcaceae bacterium]